jgi:hypothetical protein
MCARICLWLNNVRAALLACCVLCLAGCATYPVPLRGYRCEIAWHDYNPREHDAHIGFLKNLPAPVFETREMAFSDVLASLNEAGISCSTVYVAESNSDRLLTIPDPKTDVLPFIDALCAANALYWMTCDTNGLFLLPADQMNAGYVRVLPGNANWTNAVSREFSRELVRNGESPVTRNKTVRVMGHETFPEVQLNGMPFTDAVAWLCRQRDLPFVSLSKNGASNYPVSFDMTDVPLFTVLDEICRQSNHYWGFLNDRLAIVPVEEFITNDRWRLPEPVRSEESIPNHSLRQGAVYKRELAHRNHNPVLRDKLHFLVNGHLIPSVNFEDMPVMDAMRWLSKQCAQSYSAWLTDENATNRVVNLSKTNATFLATFDEVCEQSGWYWGFSDRILMTFPAAHLDQEASGPQGTGWIHMKCISPE